LTDDTDQAVEEILQFYRLFRSYRWVGSELVIRLQKQLSPEAIDQLNREFADLLVTAPIRASRALRQEKNEPDILDLPRLVCGPHRRNYGRLRQLIDAINKC